MTHFLPCLICASVLGLSLARPSAAQVPPGDAAPAEPEAQAVGKPGARLRVFLDCSSGDPDVCFSSFLRDQIDFVDFVRQAQDSDVHILATSNTTGGGGREVRLRFVGRGRLATKDDVHRAVTLPGDPESTQRDVVMRAVLIGLLDYAAHDGIPPGMKVVVTNDVAQGGRAAPVSDPWNLWVFTTRVSGNYDGNERNHSRQIQLNGSADRVTDRWKLSFGVRENRRYQTFDLEDGDSYEVDRHDRNVDGFVARGLGPHWSIGLRGRASSSTFNNNRFLYTVSPTVEFNIFPYEDYATRQLRTNYQISRRHAEYNEITTYGKTEETRWQQRVDVTLDQRQPWGSLRAGLTFSQYLHDRSKYRLEGDGNVTLRIARGLSLTFGGSASRIRDQLSLPLRNATDEEVLLQIRQLQSGYAVEFNFGITYSFGSIFNNIVNPRFGT